MRRNAFPHLRICVSCECNFSCFFCKPGGESGFTSPVQMTKEEIESVLKIAFELGFSCVKFTGGEPLLRNDILDIIERTLKIGFTDVQLITNGSHLLGFVNEPVFRKLSLLTVSLCSLNPSTFRFITKTDHFEQVYRGLLACSKTDIPLRINMVLCKPNENEFLSMLDFACKIQAELKIHELLRFRMLGSYTWNHYYVPPNRLIPILEQFACRRETIFSEGGYGSPMKKYRIKRKTSTVVYDSNAGVRYGDICKTCSLFPCQDGLYAQKVTHDGKLKRCWGRNDLNLDILSPLKKGDFELARTLFRRSTETFFRSHLYHETRPKVARRRALGAADLE